MLLLLLACGKGETTALNIDTAEETGYSVDMPLIYYPFHPDVDFDGFGDMNVVVFLSDLRDAPQSWVMNGLDCRDNMPTVNPFGRELCNNIDDDCNGVQDDGCTY